MQLAPTAGTMQRPLVHFAPLSYAPTMPATVLAPMPATLPATPADEASCNVDMEDIIHGGQGGMDIQAEPLFVVELTNDTAAQAQASWISKRTGNYTELEDKMICETWLSIG
jgi:hypothetical protein